MERGSNVDVTCRVLRVDTSSYHYKSKHGGQADLRKPIEFSFLGGPRCLALLVRTASCMGTAINELHHEWVIVALITIGVGGALQLLDSVRKWWGHRRISSYMRPKRLALTLAAAPLGL